MTELSSLPAGTGSKEALYLLEPMCYDLVNYVRQGALIASALVLIQQTEQTCPKVKHGAGCLVWSCGALVYVVR